MNGLGFFTGTIDPKKYDASNAKSLKPKLKKWFEHMVERYHISYICIFEYHKKRWYSYSWVD